MSRVTSARSSDLSLSRLLMSFAESQRDLRRLDRAMPSPTAAPTAIPIQSLRELASPFMFAVSMFPPPPSVLAGPSGPVWKRRPGVSSHTVPFSIGEVSYPEKDLRRYNSSPQSVP